MATLLSQSEFLNKYRIAAEAFEKTTLAWADLEAIHAHYTSLLPELESIATMISGQLMKVEKVHSVRYRTKDAEHLIAKIIRKRGEKPDRVIDIENYLIQVTDLIGLRAIHLYKEDWLSIHRSIIEKWDLKEGVKAYVREGDNSVNQNSFTEEGLTVENHRYGYRSIHYTAKTKPAKTEYFAEIQVRTIFEEGWSEIDHDVRYPYEQDNLLYGNFSLILNRLAGGADEMGSFITLLRAEVTTWEAKMLENKIELERLQALVDKSELPEVEKKELKRSLAGVTRLNTGNSLADFLRTNRIPSAVDALSGIASALARPDSSFGSGISGIPNLGLGSYGGPLLNFQPTTVKPVLRVSKATSKPSAEAKPPQQAEKGGNKMED